MLKKKTTARKKKDGELYEGLRFGTADLLMSLAVSLAVLALFAFLFYRSLPAVLFLMPLLPLFLKVIRQEIRRRRERQLRADLTKFLESLSLAFRSGFSAQGAFPECERSLRVLLGKDHPMTRAVRRICEGISLGIPPGDLLSAFADSSGLPEFRDVAAVFSIGLRSGGDLCLLIDTCASRITAHLEVREEIDSALASRKFELWILSCIPCGILLYLRLASPGFLDVMYGNPFGIACMTVFLLLYLLSVLWGRQIIAIEV